MTPGHHRKNLTSHATPKFFHRSDNMLTWEKWGERRVGMRKQLIKKKEKKKPTTHIDSVPHPL